MNAVTSEKSIIDLTIQSIDVGAQGINVCFSDHHKTFFHHIWLRDCCYCPICGDAYSSKRFIVPSDFALDIAPREATLGEQGQLLITWNDGHESEYEPNWLKANCYDDAAREARQHQPVLWNAHLDTGLVRASLDSVLEHDEQRLAFFRSLRDYGFAIVTGGEAQRDAVERVANLIGDLGETAYTRIFDLSPSSSVKTMGNTQRAVAPHTDEAFRYNPPGINILGCVRPAEQGGDTVLVDGFHIAQILRDENPDGFELLAAYGHTVNRWHPGSIDQRGHLRIIALNDRNEIAGIRFHSRSGGPLHLPRDILKPYYAAYHRLSELMMVEENQVRIRLESGDAVLFDNHRVMHARSEFSDPRRFLQICNVSREGFHERLRLLAADLGHLEEANQVLSPGMNW